MPLRPSGFQPVRWLPGADLQTILPVFGPTGSGRRPAEPLIVPVAPGGAVRVEVERPASGARGTLLLMHGMGGSADSGYLRRTAAAAHGRALATARMNLRTCGGTERLATTLYNAGQSDDVRSVVEALAAAGLPRPFCAVGFSLGGNILLRYAGRSGATCALDALAAINPPVDLEACARSIERPRNRLYQVHYTRGLRRKLRDVARTRPVPGIERLDRARSVRRFDELFTAPDAGYPSAERYYADASAGPWLGRIERPTLVLSAANDPIVPVGIFEPHHGLAGVWFEHPAAGGHCGYWSRNRGLAWAAETALRFLDLGP